MNCDLDQAQPCAQGRLRGAASIATLPISASARMANTTLAAAPLMRRRTSLSQSGEHNVAVGDLLPDTVSGFLSEAPQRTQ